MIIQGVSLAGTVIKDASFVSDSSTLLYLDAGNKASYPGTGTTWYDISGRGNNTTGSSGSPTYSSNNGGYFTFNGTTSYFTTTGSNYNVTYTGKTTFIAANLTSALTSGQYRNLFGLGGTGTRNFNTYLFYTGSAYQIHFSAGGIGGYSSNLTYTPGNWFTAAVTHNTNGTITWYYNGQPAGTATGTFSQYQTSQYEQVGASDNYWLGPISVVGIYGRTLSAQEILNNHNFVRGRYGL